MSSALLADTFLFSQHSLSTYQRCPRRFLLKYVDHQPWPMPEDDDPRQYQEHLARGRVFHQWLARTQLGLDMAPLAAASDDPALQAWWQAAQGFDRAALPQAIQEAELPVVVPLGRYRLYARYDYMALDPGGEAVIVDWKTLPSLPSLAVLRQRMQTRVYLYTLVAAGHVLSGGMPIDPTRARMIYWFANFPQERVEIRFSAAEHRQARQGLLRLVEEITGREREEFVLTADVRQCRRCTYRTLCQREESALAGKGEGWLDEDIDFALELEDAPELEY
jgi:hypothetical protein